MIIIKLFIWLCTVKQEVTTSLWTCKSQSETSKDLKYKISILQSSCESESCHLKCPFMDCNSLCRHMYVCKCVDYANGHICKHLHGIHCFRLKSANIENDTLSGPDTMGIFVIYYWNTINCFYNHYYTDLMVFDENPDHIMEGDSETDAAQVILPASRPIVQGIYICFWDLIKVIILLLIPSRNQVTY